MTTDFNFQHTKHYLEALYSKADRGHLVFIEPSRNRISAAFTVNQLDAAVDHIRTKGHELFLKINLMDHDAIVKRNEFGIGGVREVKALVSIHLDVDAGKDDRYLTPDRMMEIIYEMPLVPSAVIRTNGTGGGYHAYWMLDEPHYITDEADRSSCQAISTRWLEQLRKHANPGSIDGTANIDRILRPVGSVRKSGNYVQPYIWEPTRRYSLSQFLLPDAKQSAPTHYTNSLRVAGDESVIEKYLSSVGLDSVPRILTRQGYTHSRNGFWTRPGSQSGSPTGEVFTKEGREGFTVKSGAADPLSCINDRGGVGRWYSVPALWVAFEHNGDWKAAAKFCHEFFEEQKPKVDTRGITAPATSKTDPVEIIESIYSAEKQSVIQPVQFRELDTNNPSLRPPIIHGILRQGETANVIAPPKTGKSFLAGNLAWSVATGRPWLSHDTEQGRVLILDNELHSETLASRLRHIADEMQIDHEDRGAVDVVPLRGQQASVDALSLLLDVEPGEYRLVVLDALYRALPDGCSENDNAQIMRVYNALDAIADRWQAAFVVIHHTSKGNQADKALTDLGAGAGAISRAADTHIAIRPHESDGHHVLEAVTRSFKSPEPVSVRFEWPLWTATTLEPQVKRIGQRAEERAAKNDKEADELLQQAFGSNEGRSLSEAQLVRVSGMGPGRVARAVGRAVQFGLIEPKRVRRQGRKITTYVKTATVTATVKNSV